MFNFGFGALADASIDLYLEDLKDRIDALNAEVYESLNNGVYRAGFATTQLAYDEAFAGISRRSTDWSEGSAPAPT